MDSADFTFYMEELSPLMYFSGFQSRNSGGDLKLRAGKIDYLIMIQSR